jgi:flap endonuclease-1
MGVNIGKLILKKSIDLKNLNGKIVAIDAYNALYQFLAIIRTPNGTPLKDSSGRITSHLSGLFYRTCNLLELGIKVIYIFDGIPSPLKKNELKKRAKLKKEALMKYKEAISEGKIKEARKYAQRTIILKEYMTDDSKELLNLLGVPWIQAPSEGEAQAAHLVKKGDADFCASQDYDSLLFGAPYFLRNFAISGKKKLPRKKSYIEVKPEIIELEKVLKNLKITYEQFVNMGILLGTDYNPNGTKGIGPKTALKLIREHKNLETIYQVKEGKTPKELEKIRAIFFHPKVTNSYMIKWKEPDIEKVVNFLHVQRDFSEKRVRRIMEKTVEGILKTKLSPTLEEWFT